jgi:cytochrome c oxidase assembly protein subunit 11
MSQAQETPKQAARPAHTRTALSLVALVAGMTGMAFAAVPLYQLFCAQTGYGGTTKRAAAASQAVADLQITVKFDANTSSALNWNFQPEQRQVTLKLGENALAFYRATNKSDHPLTGTATFNVTPEIAGSYFNKIECFCFTEQTLQPGQTADFPVSFFVDLAILKDPDAKNIQEITLSYTFFRTNKEAAPAPRASQGAAPGSAATRSFEKAGSSG